MQLLRLCECRTKCSKNNWYGMNYIRCLAGSSHLETSWANASISLWIVILRTKKTKNWLAILVQTARLNMIRPFSWPISTTSSVVSNVSICEKLRIHISPQSYLSNKILSDKPCQHRTHDPRATTTKGYNISGGSHKCMPIMGKHTLCSKRAKMTQRRSRHCRCSDTNTIIRWDIQAR